MGQARMSEEEGKQAGAHDDTTDSVDSAWICSVTADRDDWTGSTPTDAGESLFGSNEET